MTYSRSSMKKHSGTKNAELTLCDALEIRADHLVEQLSRLQIMCRCGP